MTAITTYTTFTDSLAALSVAGVKRSFTHPPASIGSVDLPCLWPGLPSGEEAALTFIGEGGWPTLRCDLVLAVEPVGQNTQSANYANTITCIDNLSAALRAASIGRAHLHWTINANVTVTVADTTYWAIVATVEGR